ncbi:MAG TPA: hypothetical protein VM778_14945 [Gemmatimonadota bacterium]|nr:hypothetical protein [Gemmatimonadota bacterium]
MRHLATALAIVLSLPSLASAQDRMLVARAATVSDGDLAPIADAMARGESSRQVETEWRTLLEPRAARMSEGDAAGLSLRAVTLSWRSMEGELTEAIEAIGSTGACPGQARGVASARSRLESALSVQKPTDADVGAASNAFSSLSLALAACETAASTSDREDASNALGEDSEMDQFDLQDMMHRLSQTIALMSALLKASNDTAKSIIQNLKA